MFSRVGRFIYQVARRAGARNWLYINEGNRGRYHGVFTTFVDETEDEIEYPGRVTFWLISKCAYRRNVTVDGRIIRGRSSRRAFTKRRVEIRVAYTALLA